MRKSIKKANRKQMGKRGLRWILASLLIGALILPLPVHGAREHHLSRIEEDVYGLLASDGQVETLDLVVRGQIEDSNQGLYQGNFEQVESLTEGKNALLDSQGALIDGKKGQIFFQGQLKDTPLPWDIQIHYFVEGDRVTAKEFAGAEGTLKMEITTEKNGSDLQGFFENYLVQVAITLDREVVDVVSTNGNAVNKGNSQVINFIALPGEKGEFYWQGEAQNFSMKGIQFSAVPFSFTGKKPDTDSLIGGMEELHSGVEELARGAESLEQGLIQYSDGATELESGLTDWQSGWTRMEESGTVLVGGSGEILSALETLAQESQALEQMDATVLAANLGQLDQALGQLETQLSQLKVDYEDALFRLDTAMNGVDTNIDEGALQVLADANSGDATFDQLLASYRSSQDLKATYNNDRIVWSGMGPALGAVLVNLDTLRGQIQAMELQLSTVDTLALSTAMGDLYNQYQLFHGGLVTYKDGVATLGQGADSLQGGAESLSGQNVFIQGGIVQLTDGLQGLERETMAMPQTVTQAIEDMMEPYDRGDFVPMSFASLENGQVQGVQFVLVTEDIQVVKEEKEEEKPKKKSLWQQFLDLFR